MLASLFLLLILMDSKGILVDNLLLLYINRVQVSFFLLNYHFAANSVFLILCATDLHYLFVKIIKSHVMVEVKVTSIKGVWLFPLFRKIF